MTYSIVARDPSTGELGVAIQTAYFAVGRLAAYARAGVGAVATQSFVDPRYGPHGLDRLATGESPSSVLSALLADDPAPQLRQVAMIDAAGQVAVHTGEACIAHCAHRSGDGWSVQANMMATAAVPDAMAAAYGSATGDLVDRLLAALDAAEAAGGDARGAQSAALLVVDGEASDMPWAHVVCDVRVDDHPRPLDELRRLVGVHRGFRAAGRGDVDAAREALGDHDEVALTELIVAARAGDDARAASATDVLLRSRPSWSVILSGFHHTGRVALPQAVLDRLS